uniref:Uncharacterized protein n=1 Tax=Arundo donax TaxID=35708 RepID=A0A0A9FHM9_ARUDO
MKTDLYFIDRNNHLSQAGYGMHSSCRSNIKSYKVYKLMPIFMNPYLPVPMTFKFCRSTLTLYFS